MDAYEVVVKFTADVSSIVRGAQEAASAVGNVSDAEGDAGRAATMAASGTGKLTISFSTVADAAKEAADETEQLSFGFADAATSADAARDNAVQLSLGYEGVAASADDAKDQVAELTREMEKQRLIRGSGAFFGGPPGKGVATDVGAAFRNASNAVQAMLGFLTLVAPTINIIIAAAVGLVSLLGAAVVAAAAVTAALGATAAAMGLAAFKWRDLLTQTQAGAETWKGALSAIEAQAFNMTQGLIKSFTSAGQAGEDFWRSVGEAGVKFLQMMEPLITSIVEHIKNFTDALMGVKGASSPFLEFIQHWINEWKVLLAIVNKDIPPGAGILGFFEKYQPAADAFVEGIAKVINGIRKMSAMGLGLNMDQLARLISNVFDFLAALVQIFPKFSNALVGVGLQLSEFLNDMLPIISTAFDLGSAILSGIVEPLVRMALVITSTILNLPVVKWFAAVAGAALLVAAALAKLIPLFSFGQIVQAMAGAFITLSTSLGEAIVALVGFKTEYMALTTLMAGGGVIAIAIAAGFFVLKKGMEEVQDAAKQTAAVFKQSFDKMVQDGTAAVNVLHDTQDAAAASFNEMGAAGKFVYVAQHFNDVLMGLNVTQMTVKDSAEQLKDAYDGIADELTKAVSTGSFTEDQLKSFDALRKAAQSYATWTQTAGQKPADMSTADWVNSQNAAFDAAKRGAEDYGKVLNEVEAAYDAHIINGGQYAQMMQDLGRTVDDTGEKIRFMQLKTEAASNNIAQSLAMIHDNAQEATGGLETFATALGQDVVSYTSDALEAFNDLAQGLTTGGQKVNEWFQEQADAIQQWKDTMADSVNFTKQAWADLGTQANLTADDIIEALGKALDAQLGLQRNFDKVKEMFSPTVFKQILDQVSPDQYANVFAGLATATPGQVDKIEAQVKRGVDLSTAFGESAADAIDLTMKSLVAAIEVLVSQQLGVSIKRVQQMVADAVDTTSGKVDELNKKKVEIPVKFAMQKQANLKSVLERDVGPIGKPGSTGIFPKPDTATIKAQYTEAGAAANQGMASGLQHGRGQVMREATEMGDQAVKATKAAIGAASPARAFIAIGMSAVSGLAQGLSKGARSITSAAQTLGENMIQGIRTGIDSQLASLLAHVEDVIKQIEQKMREAAQAESPSKLTARLGEDLAAGIRVGFESGMGKFRPKFDQFDEDFKGRGFGPGNWAPGGLLTPKLLQPLKDTMRDAGMNSAGIRKAVDWMRLMFRRTGNVGLPAFANTGVTGKELQGTLGEIRDAIKSPNPDIQAVLEGMRNQQRIGHVGGRERDRPSHHQRFTGELTLTKQSKAYIRGVIEDELEDGRIVDHALARATARRRG